MKRFLAFYLILGVTLAFGSFSHAGSHAGSHGGRKITTPLIVSATVQAVCTVSISHLNFGPYDPTERKEANGSIDVTCAKDINYKIALDGGNNFKHGSRRMTNDEGGFIKYQLWRDGKKGLKEWGDRGFKNTHPNGSSLADVGDGTFQEHEVLGVVEPYMTNHKGKRNNQKLPSPGDYYDVIRVTIHY
jgi:spore coat protein U-like protein